MKRLLFITLVALFPLASHGQRGYYRFPTIYKEIVVFTSEGDLWKYDVKSKITQRLTSHLGMESHPDISPDGEWVAFSAMYDGPQEVYLMPINGGLPQRITYEGESAVVVGWTPDNKILYSTRHYSTLPNNQLVSVDPNTLETKILPLAQASDGVYTDDMLDLYFVRLPFQGSQTKRYKGGTVQNIWRFDLQEEAKPIASFYPGTTKNPMVIGDKLFFLSDSDDTMNLFSMPLTTNAGWIQHTNSAGWDLKEPDNYENQIVYQKGADLFLYDIESNTESLLDISLTTDFDQKRLRWITEPMKEVSDMEISNDSERLVLTSRGRVFSMPIDGGRIVEVNKEFGVRHRNGSTLGGTDDIIFLSDKSGEVELWVSDGFGIGKPYQITSESKVLIMGFQGSPNGDNIAYWDKNFDLRVVQAKTGETITVDHSPFSGYDNLSWSPDNKWLAFTKAGENTNVQIHLFNIDGKVRKVITTNRLDSYDPVWSPDSKWLYFLSDRDFQTVVRSPWGQRQPEPFYDKTTRIFGIDLQGTGGFPFKKETEIDGVNNEPKESDKVKGRRLVYADQSEPLNINGLEQRVYSIPLAGGNRSQLDVSEGRLFWVETESSPEGKKHLYSYEISNAVENKPVLIASNIRDYRLSGDGKTLLIRDESGIYITNGLDAELKKDDSRINLKSWKFQIDPKDEWRQMFVDSWRLMRDYFYDKNMHGVDWETELDKHLPLVERVSDRQELDDLIAHMVGELSTLHTFVRSRDVRKPEVEIEVASLGATFDRNLPADGYSITHIYESDPDYPDELSPLARVDLDLKIGDVLTAIDGISSLSVEHLGELLLDKVSKEVRLTIKSPGKELFDVIVTPVSANKGRNLRYSDWELSRRTKVEEQSKNQIGYMHLRAMSGPNFIEFVKGFYPVFHKQGLIIDARNNGGGNIDSWVLAKLMRKAWMYWQPREGEPYWNMQYAFRGHMVVLVNERTASDGEAFAEGFRRLGLGKVMGTRTWGGEVWLTSSNRLVDNGIASAAEFGVYGPEGEWLIEGWGVEPDEVIDNLPHATFNGKDAQLDGAIQHLLRKIEKEPITVPAHPDYPNKAVDYSQHK